MRTFCASAKPGGIRRISWKRPNEILHGTRRLSGAITSRPGQKFYSSMNAMSNSISMPFTGAMRGMVG